MSTNVRDLLNIIGQQLDALTNSKPMYVLDISELRKALPKRGITPAAIASEIGGKKISETEYAFEVPYGPEQMARRMLRQARDANKTEDAFQSDHTQAGLAIARKGTSVRRLISPEAAAILQGFNQDTNNPMVDAQLRNLNRNLTRAATSLELIETRGRSKSTVLGYSLNVSDKYLRDTKDTQKRLEAVISGYANNNAIETIQDTIINAVQEAFGNRPTRKVKAGTNYSRTVMGVKVEEVLPKLDVSRAGRFTNNGKFVSSASIMTILNRLIATYVHRHMGRPELIWRTGRFANSVQIIGLTATRNQAVQATYSYMLYPYQTFEPGFAQGHKGYDPRRLISKAIRSMLAEVMNISTVTTVRSL